MTRLAACLMTAIGVIPAAFAEDAGALRAIGEDRAGIEAIAMYPEQIRAAILEASSHPELVVKVAALQQISSSEFEQTLSALDKEDQDAIWDLARFPKLVEALVAGDIKTKREIRGIVAEYPEDIIEAALKYGRTEYDLLVDVHRLNRDTEEQFRDLLDVYPRATQESYHTLIRHPEIMTILAEDMSMTVLLGDAYDRDPEGVRELAKALNLKLASEHAKELTLGEETPQPPAQRDELSSVAAVYQQKYAYDASGFEGPREDVTDVEVTYYGAPYPYWFGYPGSYAVPAVHAGLNWYITPRVRASVSLFPSSRYYYRHAPFRHHATRWSKASRGRVVKAGARSTRRHRHRWHR